MPKPTSELATCNYQQCVCGIYKCMRNTWDNIEDLEENCWVFSFLLLLSFFLSVFNLSIKTENDSVYKTEGERERESAEA